MKSKVVTGVCIFLIVLAVACFGYIFLNIIFKDNTTDENDTTTVAQEIEEEVTQRTERGQNINTSSRIALSLKELIKYSDIYSNSIISKLDSDGLQDEAKLLIALDKIYRVEEYQAYSEYSDTYSSTYVTPENMQKVLDATFEDSTVTTKDVDDILAYDDATEVYVILPRGFGFGSIEYTLEVPYKITEYSDRIELLAYRVYITKNVEMQETETVEEYYMYSDKDKTNLIYSIYNDTSFTDSTDIDYIKEKIDNGDISSDTLESVKYTFIQDDTGYKISDFENI